MHPLFVNLSIVLTQVSLARVSKFLGSSEQTLADGICISSCPMNEKIFKKFVERKLETWKHENLKHENDTSIKKANFVITINMFITLKCIFLSHGLNDEADHQDIQGDDDVQAHVCVNVHEDPLDWLMSVMYHEDLISSPCTTLSETCLSGGSQCLLADCFSRPRCFLQWKLLFTVVS